jgi:ribulose-5-phosphate 4-epimerase/fuculose-1-phosphate aldolase
MEDTEWKLRCDLAACHHLFHHFGWTDVIFTHLSVRLPQNKNHYLTTPYGLMFDEVTASNLVKVDFDGKILAGESYMNAGHAIHTAIMKTRQDVNCILHSHTRAGIAVSCMKKGLMNLSQQSGEVQNKINYYDYHCIEFPNTRSCAQLGKDIGDKSLLIMRNHGLLSVAKNIPEALYNLYMLENACKIQVDVLRTGAELSVPSEAEWDKIGRINDSPDEHVNLFWTALLRMLDRNGADYCS